MERGAEGSATAGWSPALCRNGGFGVRDFILGFFRIIRVSLGSPDFFFLFCGGAGITYAPLAHLPRSMKRQRSLQKGKSGSVVFTVFRQMGQRSFESVSWHKIRGQRLVVRGSRLKVCARWFHLCNLTQTSTSDLITSDYLATRSYSWASVIRQR